MELKMLCPDCRSCQISSLSERCGTDRTLQAEAMNGRSSALARYNSAVPSMHRVYINVKFDEKNTVKKMGARWDADRKSWYVDSRRGNDFVAQFSKWMKKATPAPVVIREPAPVTIVPKPEPIISIDELLAATGYVSPAAPVPVPVPEKEYVSRSIARNAAYR